MNLIDSKKSTTVVDVDALLQDSYLLVVELCQGADVPSSQELMRLCVEQVGQVREQLELAGLDQRSTEHICHAQCALLDETVLTRAQGDVHACWAGEPLQARFFNRHQAGEFLYEDMREVLREPAPDRHVLTAFQRVLMLGFRGRYRELDDPEREQLLADLSARISPLKTSQGLVTQAGGRGPAASLAWLRWPLVDVLAVGALLATAWWGLDLLLSDVIGSLWPARG